MAVLFHGTYGYQFSSMHVFFGVEQASAQFTFAPGVFSSYEFGIMNGILCYFVVHISCM